MDLNQLPDLSGCIPHSGPMRLIDRYLGWYPQDKLCMTAGLVTSDRRSVDENGVFKSEWLLEMMAQGVAAHFYLSGVRSGPPKPGFLVSVRRYSVRSLPEIRIGDELIIRSVFEAGVFPVGSYLSEIYLKNKCLAESNMTFIVSEKGGWH